MAGKSHQDRMNVHANLLKFKWEELKIYEDSQPLNVTTTTDMAADWKLVGAGGGVT